MFGPPLDFGKGWSIFASSGFNFLPLYWQIPLSLSQMLFFVGRNLFIGTSEYLEETMIVGTLIVSLLVLISKSQSLIGS